MNPKEFYQMDDPKRVAAIKATRRKCQQYNEIPADQDWEKAALLEQFLGAWGKNSVIQQPFRCDLGKNISIGQYVFINYNCVMLDTSPITIGDNTLIGPNVGLYAASHPISPKRRLDGNCWSAAITIGENVWIGGNACILPGVTIGDNVVIGAGSVVTKDIPANCVAAGNPARIIKKVEE